MVAQRRRRRRGRINGSNQIVTSWQLAKRCRVKRVLQWTFCESQSLRKAISIVMPYDKKACYVWFISSVFSALIFKIWLVACCYERNLNGVGGEVTKTSKNFRLHLILFFSIFLSFFSRAFSLFLFLSHSFFIPASLSVLSHFFLSLLSVFSLPISRCFSYFLF